LIDFLQFEKPIKQLPQTAVSQQSNLKFI